MIAITSAALITVSVLLAIPAIAQDAQPANPSLLKASFSKLQIYFIENRDVYQDEVKYYIKGSDKALFFAKEG